MLLSEMTKEQLQQEMDELQQKGQKAFDEERWDQYEVLMQRWYLARSYMIRDDTELHVGQVYKLAEEPNESFTVTKTEGVMAWGIRMSTGLESAIPLAMLVEA